MKKKCPDLSEVLDAIEKVLSSPSIFNSSNFDWNKYFLKKNKKRLKELKSEKNPYKEDAKGVFDGPYSRWNFEHSREIYNIQQHINELKQKIK